MIDWCGGKPLPGLGMRISHDRAARSGWLLRGWDGNMVNHWELRLLDCPIGRRGCQVALAGWPASAKMW